MLGIALWKETLKVHGQGGLVEALVEHGHAHLVTQLVHQVLDEDAAAKTCVYVLYVSIYAYCN